jgi:hypothetical protein
VRVHSASPRITEVWRHQRSRLKSNGQPPESSQLGLAENLILIGPPRRPSGENRGNYALSNQIPQEVCVRPVLEGRSPDQAMRWIGRMLAFGGQGCPIRFSPVCGATPSLSRASPPFRGSFASLLFERKGLVLIDGDDLECHLPILYANSEPGEFGPLSWA